MPRKMTRYAVVGTGGRVTMFIDPLATRFNKTNQIVGLCDTNPGRLEYHNDRLVSLGHPRVATYLAKDFDRMIRETKPDAVIVTTVDAFHHQYIIRALELGCDAITEKPMTTDDKKCRAIFDAVKRTGRNVRVTFNYRWAPGPTLVKQLLSRDIIGEIIHVDMEYLLNTSHGADYFRRWHREKDKSGGLMVHKSTHHFDLVNWWINSVPEEVYGHGRLAFYGRKNAEKRGLKVKYSRYTGQNTKGDPFALKLTDQGYMLDMYAKTEKYDGYIRDRNVFGDNISAEDTMSLLVKYRTGIVLNYSLNAYLPREGFHIVFNGTKGRLEYNEDHGMHVIEGSKKNSSPEGHDLNWESRCIVHPLFGRPYRVEIPKAEGTHGGSDPLLAEQIFSPKPPKEKWGRNAGHEQGAASILIGIAANQCFVTHKPVSIAKLCPQLGNRKKLSELK
ncbi:MAG: Gfo/Idh/MocA family oxidoreductase [Phycisphaeraceae bacterium]|nr:Gfo/Idh/MocA family oxidoreductase [Phycisphaeraceae bacterium]